MSGLIFREITSTENSGNPLTLGSRPVFRAYNKYGRWALMAQAKFRTDLKNTPEAARIEFVAKRLRRNFNDTANDSNMPRLLIQHTPDAELPAFDLAAHITAYHGMRRLAIYDEVDTPGAAVSIAVFPDMTAGGLPADGNVQYLLPLLFMVLRQIDVDTASQDEMLRAYFGTMLVSKCR